MTHRTCLCAALALLLTACGKESAQTPPVYGGGTDPSSETPSPEGTNGREALADYADMVLLYGYGHHRSPYAWGTEYTDHYVWYTDRSGHTEWLFDAFLLLEFMDPPVAGGAGKTFITGYLWDDDYLRKSANQQDWANLVRYYFVDGTSVDALDQSVETGKRLTGGDPPYKRQIIVGIPEPIKTENPFDPVSSTTYWGKVDGRTLDFNLPADRVTAVRWYIDQVREAFAQRNYQNVELAGFYWVAEKSTQTADIIGPVGTYLKSLNYHFNWIPYFHADGYTRWKEFGFTYAFMQPNYFFNDDIPYDRLVTACNDVIRNNMGLEVEFDGNVLVSWGRHRGPRLRDYMKAFSDYGAWEKSRLVYYQGSWAVKDMHLSTNAEDQDLYYDFCDWVVSRPFRKTLVQP